MPPTVVLTKCLILRLTSSSKLVKSRSMKPCLAQLRLLRLQACKRWEKASLKKKTSLQVVKMKKKLQLKSQLLLLRLPPSMVHPLLPPRGDLDSNHFEMELKPKDKKSKLLLRGRSPRQEKPRALSDTMSREFEMSMMGELTFFLGLQIKQSKEGTFVHQGKYMKDVLKKFDMADAKPLSTPMVTTTALDADEDGEAVDQKEYRSMIGSLL